MFAPKPHPSTRLRIIVLGYIVRGPLGGLAWHHLQYVMGLARLGHDVYFIEESGDYPSCYDPSQNAISVDPTYGLGFIERTFSRVGLADHWAYFDEHTNHWFGPCANRVNDLCTSADLVVNISAVNALSELLQRVPVRALIDTDPCFVQIRHLTQPDAYALAQRHTAFFSFGENIGRPNCTVPDDGLPWQPTRQPMVLDSWPVTSGPIDGKFTTVMQWESYPPREYGGRYYGVKADSFSPYLDLPSRAGRLFELALGSASAPRSRLRRAGWTLRNPLRPTRDPWSYQRYLRRSKAEFAVAKHGYVASCSGWFSERSAAYLASGRPVLIQETGFSDWLRADGGVVPFNTPEEAVAGIDRIGQRYPWHCEQARNIAEHYFDAAPVLTSLLERTMNPGAVQVHTAKP